ncbi:bcl-2-like protein 11 [Centroberyx gerrardi]
MSRPCRPPNRSDGSSAVTEESGGESLPVGAGGAAAQTSRSKPANEPGGGRSADHAGNTGGEGDSPSRGGIEPIASPSSLTGESRSLQFQLSRLSSGYFSLDGDSSPGVADKATQTPSPSCQAVKHALQYMAEAAHREPEQQHGSPSGPSRNTAGDMQPEAQAKAEAGEIGRELRRIGDDFNSCIMQRRLAARHGQVPVPPNPLPHIHQEPVFLLCVGLVLVVIGRILYLQGDTNSHSPV